MALSLLFAASVWPEDFTYTTNSGAITITGYTGPGGAVIIPDTINGRLVASIYPQVFFKRTNLTSVTIPDTITFINYQTFYDCTHLTSVKIGNSVSTIVGGGAFA